MEEAKTLIDVLDFVNSHATGVGPREPLPADDLQQFEETATVGQVDEQVVHLHASLEDSISFTYKSTLISDISAEKVCFNALIV